MILQLSLHPTSAQSQRPVSSRHGILRNEKPALLRTDMLGVNSGPGLARDAGEQPRPLLTPRLHCLTLDVLVWEGGSGSNALTKQS